jgi:hypothetical protein
VHDAGVIVRNVQVEQFPRVNLLEVVHLIVRDVLLHNLDEAVSVRPGLLVVEPQRVAQLVNHYPLLLARVHTELNVVHPQ